MTPLRIAIFVSGSGSNMEALIRLAQSHPAHLTVALVIASNDHCAAIGKAEAFGVPVQVLRAKAYASVSDYEAALQDALLAHHTQLICLAGFMRLLSGAFVNQWHNRLINIHPSLLPSFKGMHAIAQAVEAGVWLVGCTVHAVREAMDAGPILAQAALNRLPGETLEALTARIHPLEHACYQHVVLALATGRVTLQDETVIWHEPTQPQQLLSWSTV